MKWKNIKLGRKFFIAFGTLVLLLAFVAFWSIFGINGIVGNAEEVIEGNKLRTDLEHKYVQHLHWAKSVNELITNDEVKQMDVELDHTQCAFGKWYFGEGRQHAEELAPELASLFDQMEEPHKHLHESAKKIKATFTQADRGLSNMLREAKSDHLIFAHRLKDVAVNAEQVDRINVQKDPTQCNFGKWLYSDETKELQRKYPEFAAICQKVEDPHNKLHQEVDQMESYFRAGNIGTGKNHYMGVIKPTTYDVLDVIDEMVAWNDEKLARMDYSLEIYHDETTKHLGEVGNLFEDIIEKSKGYIMTDEAMLGEANKTQGGVIIFSIIAIVIAIILAYVITKGIVRPINKGVNFAQEVAKGDLTAKIDIDQEDEIGVLASSLSSMVNKLREIVTSIMSGADSIASASNQMSSTSQEMSQGASEQASSAEEVSSSMEEMVSNIQQNTENAQQTEKIALSAVEGIREGYKSTEISVTSMKNIAEKIKIINDIAFQTNILALNAAVEAARAGEHGKGFAVVAAEVRKLAERSKVAADEIDELSQSGVSISEKAGKQLAEIVPEIEKTAKLVQEISAASLEQTSGADQVNNAIQQLNQVTQQNAAASEEMATSAEELSSQADQLKDYVSYFDIGEEALRNSLKKKSNIKKAEHQPVSPSGNGQSKKQEESGYALNLEGDKDDSQYENF